MLIAKTKKITNETYNRLVNMEEKRILDFIKINNIEICDYEPEEDEIPDIVAPVIQEFNDDTTDSDNEEKDYVDQILDECKV